MLGGRRGAVRSGPVNCSLTNPIGEDHSIVRNCRAAASCGRTWTLSIARQKRRHPWVWVTRGSQGNRGKKSLWRLSENVVRRVLDPPGCGVYPRLQIVLNVSGAVGPDTNDMSAGSRSLLKVRLGRMQAGRFGLRGCHWMLGKRQKDPKGASVTRVHWGPRNWRRGESGMTT